MLLCTTSSGCKTELLAVPHETTHPFLETSDVDLRNSNLVPCD